VPSRRTTIGVPATGSGTTATLIPATVPTLSPVSDPTVPARRHRGAAYARLLKATDRATTWRWVATVDAAPVGSVRRAIHPCSCLVRQRHFVIFGVSGVNGAATA